MLRNEIQEKTGLTRKALEYYEEKGLVNPEKNENGYRNYSKEDLELLRKISMLRKLGMSVGEIEKCILTDYKALASILRRKEHELDIDEKRKNVLNLLIIGESEKIINEKISQIENEETIYEKLERIFPGYFGQLLFASYKPFLSETLDKDEEKAFEKYVKFLDQLPQFDISEEEKIYIEKISTDLDMKTLENIVESKNNAIKNPKTRLYENKEAIEQYELYKSSESYQNSEMKKIYDKLLEFMKANNYYEIAIPLIRKFSKSYNEYYEKLLKANQQYINFKS